MRLSVSREWLDRFLSSSVAPDEADLKKLVEECRKEDQHLEYKSGRILTKQDAADTIREYVAAFANSDGGTLLVGYDEKAGFDGVTAPGGATIEEWVNRSIYGLAPFLSQPPRVHAPQACGVTVLLIATARAPRLVPITLKRDLVYYLRIGDSNFAAPPFLLSDLVLGRRNHPVLRLGPVSGTASPSFGIGRQMIEGTHIDLRVIIENASLAFAEDVRCGLITWSCPKDRPSVRDGMEVPDSLKASLDITEPPHYRPQETRPAWTLTHVRLSRHAAPGFGRRLDEPPIDIGAVDQTTPLTLKTFTIPVFPNSLSQAPAAGSPSSRFYEDGLQVRIQMRGAVELRAALYVLSRNAEPWWLQFVMRYDNQLLAAATALGDISKLIEVGPVLTPRPVVGLDFCVPTGETI